MGSPSFGNTGEAGRLRHSISVAWNLILLEMGAGDAGSTARALASIMLQPAYRFRSWSSYPDGPEAFDLARASYSAEAVAVYERPTSIAARTLLIRAEGT